MGIKYLNEEIRRNPKLTESYGVRSSVMDNWETFWIIVPEDVFEKTGLINLDGLTIELEYVGGQHAEDSIVVKVPQDGVLFLERSRI